MNTPSLSTLAVLFAACVATTSAGAADAPKSDPGKTTATPKPAPAPAPVSKTAEPPRAPAPAPVPKPAPAPAPKAPEPTHSPAPTPAPKPAPVPAPAPKPTEPPHTTAPAPAPVPAPAPKPTPAPAPAPVSATTNTWDNWQNAKPVPTSFPAGVVFAKSGSDAATGDRQAWFVGRTDVATTQGKAGEQHTASGAIRLSADLGAQTISGQMGSFTSSTAATASTLNAMALTMSGTYDANGKITGTTSAQGQALGKVSGTLTTTIAQGAWTLAKNDFAINATFRAGRVNAPGH